MPFSFARAWHSVLPHRHTAHRSGNSIGVLHIPTTAFMCGGRDRHTSPLTLLPSLCFCSHHFVLHRASALSSFLSLKPSAMSGIAYSGSTSSLRLGFTNPQSRFHLIMPRHQDRIQIVVSSVYDAGMKSRFLRHLPFRTAQHSDPSNSIHYPQGEQE